MPITTNVSAPTEDMINMEDQELFNSQTSQDYPIKSATLCRKEIAFDTDDNNYDNFDMDAIEHLAGVTLNKSIKLGKDVAHFIETDPEKCKERRWTQLLSEGDLKYPNEAFISKIKELDIAFNAHNGGSFNFGKGYMARLIQSAKEIDLHYDIKHYFFRCKTEFRIKEMNKVIVKRVHDSKLRKITT